MIGPRKQNSRPQQGRCCGRPRASCRNSLTAAITSFAESGSPGQEKNARPGTGANQFGTGATFCRAGQSRTTSVIKISLLARGPFARRIPGIARKRSREPRGICTICP